MGVQVVHAAVLVKAWGQGTGVTLQPVEGVPAAAAIVLRHNDTEVSVPEQGAAIHLGVVDLQRWIGGREVCKSERPAEFCEQAHRLPRFVAGIADGAARRMRSLGSRHGTDRSPRVVTSLVARTPAKKGVALRPVFHLEGVNPHDARPLLDVGKSYDNGPNVAICLG